jgi:hypothetical protein
MNMAMHFKGALAAEDLGQGLARLSFVRVEQAVRIHLVDEFVIIAEGQGIAGLYGDFRWREAATFLDDTVVFGMGSQRNQGEQKRDAFHLLTT